MPRIRGKQITPGENCIPPVPTAAGRMTYAKGSPLAWVETSTPSATTSEMIWDGTDWAPRKIVDSGTALPSAAVGLVGQMYALQVANASGEQLYTCIPRGAGYAWKQCANGLWIPDLTSSTGFTVTQSSGGTGTTTTAIASGKISFASSTNYNPTTGSSVSFNRPATISNRRRVRYQIQVLTGPTVPNVATYNLAVTLINGASGDGAGGGYRVTIIGNGTLRVDRFRAGTFTNLNVTSGFVPASWTGGFIVGLIIDPLSGSVSLETNGGGAQGTTAGNFQVIRDYTGNESVVTSTTASDNNSWWQSAFASSSLTMNSTAGTAGTTAFDVTLQMEELGETA